MAKDVAALVAELTLQEKARLTAGSTLWSTAAIERLGIPEVFVTDGPNGARGPDVPGGGGPPSACLPCATAVGATWDPAVAEALGRLAGREARDRGCHVLLAPTVNLHRSPLAGRNFECYSEDPLLSGVLAAGFVRGVQSNDVAAVVKHFVGNEAELERSKTSSVIDERALRELYLLPFELVVRDAGVLGVMTSYNRLNGSWLTEQPAMLEDLLRGEWGFEGIVMTDWFAVTDTDASLAAGLDLEMPGPGRAFGDVLVEAVRDGRVKEDDLDRAVTRLLTVFDRVGALDPTEPAGPRPVSDDDRTLLRRAVSSSVVLLQNDGTLPLAPSGATSVAVIGQLATTPTLMGGGAAQVTPHPAASPLEALVMALGDGAHVVHARGVEIDRSAALVGGSVLHAPDGFTMEVHDGGDAGAPVVDELHLDHLRHLFIAGLDATSAPAERVLVARGTVVPEESGTFELALSQAGEARVSVDGRVVLDGVSHPPPPGGTDFFGLGSQELRADLTVEAGVPIEVVVEYHGSQDTLVGGFRLGFRTPDTDALLARAVEAAAAASVAVVFVGTTQEWETEGRDRSTLDLPGRQVELIRAVAAANPRTVVVVNAGAPVDMSWAGEVAAVLQCWFGGQELGAGVADVLVGASDPGGRLPTTIPADLRHNPSYDNFPGENGEVRYGEGLFMGYRGYEHRAIAPAYPFGFGLGYTTFEVGAPDPSTTSVRTGEPVTIRVPVTNTGSRPGTAVVQCYVAPEAPRLVRPPKELKAFAKVDLEPGASTTVELVLDGRAFAYWDPGQADWEAVSARASDLFGGEGTQDRRPPGWQIDPGRYTVHVGTSSADLTGSATIELLP